jgi:hypothetical protein
MKIAAGHPEYGLILIASEPNCYMHLFHNYVFESVPVPFIYYLRMCSLITGN